MKGVGKFLQGISRVEIGGLIGCGLIVILHVPLDGASLFGLDVLSTKQQNRLCDGLGVGELGGWSSITMLHDEMFLPDCVIAPPKTTCPSNMRDVFNWSSGSRSSKLACVFQIHDAFRAMG